MKALVLHTVDGDVKSWLCLSGKNILKSERTEEEVVKKIQTCSLSWLQQMEIGVLPRDVGGNKVPFVPCFNSGLIYTSALRLMRRGLSSESDNIVCVDAQVFVRPTFRKKVAGDTPYSVSTTKAQIIGAW